MSTKMTKISLVNCEIQTSILALKLKYQDHFAQMHLSHWIIQLVLLSSFGLSLDLQLTMLSAQQLKINLLKNSI